MHNNDEYMEKQSQVLFFFSSKVENIGISNRHPRSSSLIESSYTCVCACVYAIVVIINQHNSVKTTSDKKKRGRTCSN